MLEITIPAIEQWDELKEEFISSKEQKLLLEHSLISISKWESNWKKPYLSKEPKTKAETLDYIKCMTVSKNVKPEVYSFLTNENIEQILAYIGDSMTATRLPENKSGKGSGEQITSELVYYWMTQWNIPPEYQKWHFSRLITLIQICNIKNQPAKKMSKSEIMQRNASINAARRKKFNTRG
ncbi:hypothetical protein [[Clostridium] innocuum]|uniref:hypothetical protein n=1 Tax=Clostridium innocuum TaxID=1522 RepID=UPI001AF72749|nr:hypothetical protein [[Clostridium] innocuum]QSI27773.1 hypothetical protein GKZ87_20830 [Erysipelotrichaceae bacterium 66202529]DAU14211.1 MAG TPA: hypothetical protein [Caudoviricetes sp.]MCC2832121.1 hypothetical protein [[Clostridium] innocuum]MCR0247047.1 hypothetical protein [[Clostridium] innocuum]MCR0258409.1 hypothetical protein [[Clostridium] innocuum]